MGNIKIQGEQFTIQIKIVGYQMNECDQVIAVVYRKNKLEFDNKMYFVKNYTDSYSDAVLLHENENDSTIIELEFSQEMTNNIDSGVYYVEIERHINNSIIKTKNKIFEIVNSAV